MSGTRGWLRGLAPWIVAALVIGALLWRYSPRAIAAELARGDVLALLPWTLGVAAVSLAIMTVADWLVLVPSLGARERLRLRDVAGGRAATSLLSTLSYGLSSGGYGVWIARRTGAGAAATVGATTYQLASDLGAVCLFALPAALLGADLLPARVGASAAVVAGLGVLGVTALLVLGPRVAPRRLRESRVVAAWRRVPPGAGALGAVLRTAGLGVHIAGTWGAARAFGMELPAEALAAGLPIVYLVGALPMNVLGLGAVQAAWVALFAAHAPGARLLAFQFAYQLMTIVAILVRGLPFLPRVLRDLGPRDAAPDPPGPAPG